MLAQVLRGNIYQDSEIRAKGDASVLCKENGVNWARGEVTVDQLEETRDFTGQDALSFHEGALWLVLTLSAS